MNLSDFKELIKKNSDKGRKTEFFKVNLSIDDYRKSKPTDYGIEETFVADYDKNNRDYIIYYPDRESEHRLKNNDVEEEFYEKGWGGYMHK